MSELNKEQKGITKFWLRVNKEPGQGPNGDCWEWTGKRNRGGSEGYGRYVLDGKSNIASRLSFSLTHPDEDIEGFMVCHHCDNPPCVNPAHLFKGTAKDNMQDMVNKGRGRGGIPPTGTSYCTGCKEFLLFRYFTKKNSRNNGCNTLCKKCCKGKTKNPTETRKIKLQTEINEINELLGILKEFRARNKVVTSNSAELEALNQIYASFCDKKAVDWGIPTPKPVNNYHEHVKLAPSLHLTITTNLDGGLQTYAMFC